MHWSLYFIYVATIALIRAYKWFELQLLFATTSVLKSKVKGVARSIGVILHCPDDDDKAENNIQTGKHRKPENIKSRRRRKHYAELVHIKVNDDKYFARLANLGSLGFGEMFMDGTWDVFHNNVEDITEYATRLLENGLVDLYYHPWNKFLEWLELYAFNLQTRKRAFQVGVEHYDLGNDLYQTMLDPWLQYTCGYWKDAKNLNEAQLNKMELIAQKLDLKPGMRVLDIGCGWGTLCKYLSEKYKVECVGITISEEGVTYGKQICKGLPIDIRLQDYRDVNEKFDRIVSVGMFEHVGHWNYQEYFEVCSRCLSDDGIFLLHTIGRNHYTYPQRSDPWSNKYIFPNGQVPSPRDIADSTMNKFVIEDWQNFGQDYAKTLYCWRENFMEGWHKIKDRYSNGGGDGKNFYRMWVCYLSFARALFRARRLQLWQIVLTKDGLKREYRAVR